MRLLVEELLHGNRTIITNLPVKVGELNAYMQREYPNKTIDVCGRIRIFGEEEMKGFFTIRPIGSTGPKLLTKQQWEAGQKPDYTGIADHGVMYIVDEVHIGFNARQWAETGRDVLYYLSQHRKLGDTVVCVTQAVGNVDKQFRSVTQDYTYIRNLSKEKMSKFRLPNLFVRQTFQNPPTGNEVPMETGTFKLDVSGLAACYDTAQGVGIHGKAGADITERKTGLPWWVFVIAVVIAVILIAKVVPSMIANYFKSPIQSGKKTTPVQPAKTNETVSTYVPATNIVNKVATWQPQPETNETTVTMISSITGKYIVEMSDGERYIQGDPKLQSITYRGVVIDGKLHKYKKPEQAAGIGYVEMVNVQTEPETEPLQPKRRVKVVPGPNWQSYQP